MSADGEAPAAPETEPKSAQSSPVPPVPEGAGASVSAPAETPKPAESVAMPSDTSKPADAPAASAMPDAAKPATPPAPDGARKPHKKWNPSKPDPMSKRLGWILVFVATTCVVVLGLFIFIFTSISTKPDTGPVALAMPYRNNDDGFTISSPINWTVDDHFNGASVAIKGPQERGMSPLILVAMEIAPGRLKSYLEEHKRRLSHQEESLQWLSEEEITMDGCPAVRLVYESDVEIEEGKPKVRVHAVQYIMDDNPRFYRITCFTNASLFERYRAKFEASSNSFKRLPLVTPFPQIIK